MQNRIEQMEKIARKAQASGHSQLPAGQNSKTPMKMIHALD
jgi:hypothetical protein